MYYFDIIELLKKDKCLSANDIFFILHKKGKRPNIQGIRRSLLKIYVSKDEVYRERRNSNTGGVKYYYFLKKTNI